MKAMWQRFWREEDGLETVEYAIITGLNVVAMIAAVVFLGAWVLGKFTALDSVLQGR